MTGWILEGVLQCPRCTLYIDYCGTPEDLQKAIDQHEDLGKQAAAAQAAAEESQEPAGDDTLPVEEPPDWPETAKPGTGTPKGK